jgi:hypothetical protein
MRLQIVPWAVLTALAVQVTVPAKDIPLSRCPAAVQETIRKHARDGKIDEVESLSIEGRRMFIAEVEFPGDRELKIYVLATGTLVKTREDVELRETPAAVQEAAEKLIPPGGKVDDVVRTTEAGGQVSYEVEIERPGKRGDLKIVFSSEGTILSRKDKSAD